MSGPPWAGEPRGYRLIAFVGPPGGGKSTLSGWLCRELGRHALPASLLSEQEAYRLDALQPFTAEWSRSDPGGIDSLLDAVRTLCVAWNASNTVWITDQFLPAFHWLHGKYSPGHIEMYAEALAPILHPLHPLIVYLEADVYAAWRRAVEERGQSWSDWMVDVFRKFDVPLYPGGPIQDLDDLLRFFVWEQRQSRVLLARWPGQTLILPATATSLDELKDVILQHLDLND